MASFNMKRSLCNRPPLSCCYENDSKINCDPNQIARDPFKRLRTTHKIHNILTGWSIRFSLAHYTIQTRDFWEVRRERKKRVCVCSVCRVPRLSRGRGYTCVVLDIQRSYCRYTEKFSENDGLKGILCHSRGPSSLSQISETLLTRGAGRNDP